MPTTAVASTVSLHPRLTSREGVQIMLFLVIPIYARSYILPSISSVFEHIKIIGTMGICQIILSKGLVSLEQVFYVVYGLAISSIPGLSKSYSLLAWFVPDVEGWRGVMIEWVFVATSLRIVLPKNYGSDIMALSAEYKRACPSFFIYKASYSALIFWCFFGQRGYSWWNVIKIWRNIAHLFEEVYLIRLNYICLCKTGKTVEEMSWPDEYMYKPPWPLPMAIYERIRERVDIGEVIQRYATGGIRPIA